MEVWTIQQIKNFFKVKDTRTIDKFCKQGLKYFLVGREKRFIKDDVLEFVELQKQKEQFKLEDKILKISPPRRTLNIDFQKRRINLEQNRVV